MRLLLVALVLVGGCIESDLRTCANGLLCAGVCTSQGTCASEQQVAACKGRAPFDPCSTAEVLDGVCVSDVCIPAGCGNGVIEPATEACDDGNRVGGDGCSAACSSNETCGNGVRDSNEACDDGNNIPADGCQPDCQLPRCGDGIVDPDRDEVCDDGNLVNGDQCREDCRSTELCGNGVLDYQVGEQCDLGAANSDTPDSACRTTCRIPRCGDGIIDVAAGEGCDGGLLNSNDPDAACRPGCQPRRCGDGTPDVIAGEVCDDHNVVSGDGCSGDCASTETCGNGYLDAVKGEQCDAGAGTSHDGCSSSCGVELPLWRQVVPQSFEPRYGASLIYAADRDRLVLFGGADDGSNPPAYYGDTWLFDGWVWTRHPPGIAPSKRAGAAMAYDTDRKRVVLFGGGYYDGNTNSNYDDTWEFDGTVWTQVSPATSPPAASNGQMTYDPVRHVTVLILSDEAWTYDGLTWTAAPAPPPTGYTFGLTFSPAQNQNVLLTESGDTWLFDGTTWSPVATATAPGSGPIVYDTARDKVSLILAGTSGVYDFNGTTWSQRSITNPPSFLYGAAVAYDTLRQREIAVGGLASFGGSPFMYALGASTAALLTSPSPTAQPSGGSLAYDAVHTRLVLVTNGTTWIWEGSAWSPRGSGSPAGALAYDRARDQVIAYDGTATWTWNGTVWTQLAIANPPPRSMMALTYDEANARVVLFGGIGTSYNSLADTWFFDGQSWTQLVTPTHPSARSAHAMTYDVARQKVVLVGGSGSDGTWELSGSTWTRTANDPGQRNELVVAYDAQRQHVIMFGGFDGLFRADTLAYDGVTWTPIAVPLAPAGRFGHVGAYYPPRHEMVIYGGVVSSGTVADTWSFAYLNQNSEEERCVRSTEDADSDGLAGCADPDCWYRCSPECPPATSCSPGAPGCGDGLCTSLEDVALCPVDCTP